MMDSGVLLIFRRIWILLYFPGGIFFHNDTNTERGNIIVTNHVEPARNWLLAIAYMNNELRLLQQ
jgi:hypothetical protein